MEQQNISEVLRLIVHPLNNGRKLIKGESKLVVQSDLLHQFNTLLDLVENKPSDIIIYHVDKKNLESFEKLLNRIPKLLVTQRSIHSHDNFVDIRRFKKLRHLELIRIPLDKVKGLNALKPQLEYFLCDHCSNVEIITKSGKLQWSELVTLKLRNSPVIIAEQFFISMPWIQHLDLSFTNLRKLDALQCLDNLKFLNISFNHLERLPALSSAACCQLQILLINHNYLQDLQGLECLINLRGLDLSWNWITEKRTLSPLLNLKALQWINMSNNPFSFTEYYRLYLASAIGSSSARHQFVIDDVGLNWKEQGVMGTGLGIVRCCKSKYTPGVVSVHHETAPSSQENIASSVPSSSNPTSLRSKVKPRVGIGKKGIKVREVVIEDFSEISTEDTAKLIKNEVQVTKEETLTNVDINRQEVKKDSPKFGSENDALNKTILEKGTSERFLNEERKCEVAAENNENQQIINTPNSSITLGILEVEIHESSKNNVSIEENSINIDDSTNENVEDSHKSSPLSEQLEVSIADTPNIVNVENLDISTEQNVSEIFHSTMDEYKLGTEPIIESETLLEPPIIDTNTENDNKNSSSSNFDQSEDIISSAESHQDDQDYFSATEDKERTKTLSSIDSNDLRQSHETIDSMGSHQEGAAFITVTEENITQNLILSSTDTPVNMSPKLDEPLSKLEEGITKMEIDQDSDSESSGISDVEYEMWHVQKVDNKTKDVQSILLVLLENEIKERSPVSGRTVTRWSLDSVQSCVKTKSEPFTIELEFDTVKPEKQSRIYIMEFSDAQALIKRMYNILESRPLSAMNQSTYSCSKCDTMFVQNTPDTSAEKVSQVKCTVCSSLTVTLMEEPRPPENKSQSSKPISHSPSQSSIGSAASLSQGQKLGAPTTGRNTPRKYESDIEIISNPSQSSVEVLDECGRSQVSTPCRKRSSEERQIVAIPPQLGTVLEVNAQLSALTESSSSGSLTESVITTYESHNLLNKKPKPEECLIEESREGSPVTELDSSTSQGTLFEENGNISQINSSNNITDIYNYNDFAQIDVRINLFLYQTIFHDENEELLLLVKCHLWKTGGVDYDGCVVFSTTKLYFLSHSVTKFKEDTCDWLTLYDSVSLKDIKKISLLLWHQGAVLNTNKINYLILLMDKERTCNFFKFLEGVSLKELKIQNYANTKQEMSLQQAVLSSNVSHNSVDPTVAAFSICLRICINKDDEEEILRLGGLVITGSEFHLVPGDLSWLCTNVVPNIHVSQQIASLIEVEKTENSLKFHFLDEEEALEEIWTVKFATNEQVTLMVDSIKVAWEGMFLVPLEVTVK